MSTRIPPWNVLIDRCRARKAEVARLARAGVFTHESELVEADDPRLAEWAARIEEESKPCP